MMPTQLTYPVPRRLWTVDSTATGPKKDKGEGGDDVSGGKSL
jgi:hypothetical protein